MPSVSTYYAKQHAHPPPHREASKGTYGGCHEQSGSSLAAAAGCSHCLLHPWESSPPAPLEAELVARARRYALEVAKPAKAFVECGERDLGLEKVSGGVRKGRGP
eukprot:CAMPEP_0181229050 /NCGR_PEP_ID=MMETSP1096-20121128/33682_1 /TAXON_ID=156174 ORGANISM="Chrysochromulina ericina, Strain CCMP281" /NCGR_SAMPLE_ID=MMETSP1096 /ASSEMBLY_ACC=CAM_ASM_000453 /LENGTH=104 /DNA_ID=CAMNT_0023322631 /DNA_START=255 /DNA_END=570 /DNA_ORIENTATION=+